MTTKSSKYIWENKNWANFQWSSDRLLPFLGKARQTQGKILTRVGALGVPLTDQAQAEILTEEAMQTSAIEGEFLNRDSVRSSVARHLGLSQAGLPKAERHVDGLVEVLLDATREYDKPLTVKRLQSWHAALFPTGPVEKIDQEMKGFLDWWAKSNGKMEGFLRAAIAHFWFVTIHPFDDGNGRIARVLTDMALAQDEKLQMRFYSLSSQIMEDRGDYYDVLEKCSKGKSDITAWLEWFLGCSVRAMQKSETTIGNVLAKADFWQKYGQLTMNERQRKVVNKLLDLGAGEFQGGLTTRKYVSLTKTSRATAFREIFDLVDKKVLRQNPESKGRNVSYDLNWA
jgi:Fic family protein